MLSFKGAVRFTAAVAILAVAFSARALAQSEEASATAYAVNAPISGVPQGPYRVWSEEHRRTSFGRIRSFCQFLCVDKYAGAAFHDRAAAERTAAEAKVCLGACVAGHLPADYPGLAELVKLLQADYAKAKQLGSKAPWPLTGR